MPPPAARPGGFRTKWADIKGVSIQVNSIYNNWRFDDVWLE